MLTLGRKDGETVVLRDRVSKRVYATVTMIRRRSRDGTATSALGLDAPQDVEILRGELIKEVKPCQ